MGNKVVVPTRVCIECHGPLDGSEPYIYMPARKHCQPAFRHADCHDVCGALGKHLPSQPRLGEMLDAWQLLRNLVPPDIWGATESLQRLQRSMAAIHERMDATRRKR